MFTVFICWTVLERESWKFALPAEVDVRLFVELFSPITNKINCKKRERGTYPILGLRLVVDIAHMRSCVAR